MAEVTSAYQTGSHVLGSGYSGKVYVGTLPEDFAGFLIAPDSHWKGGKTQVAVKLAKNDRVNQLTLRHEFEMGQAVSKYDSDSVFMRYAFDSKRSALVSTYDPQFVSMDSWLKNQGAGISRFSIDRITGELHKALDVLKKAQLVHSDLDPKNILIHPKTLQIKIIDFGIMSPVNEYSLPRKNLKFNRRGGRTKSQNQKRDLPAQYADDEYAVDSILKKVATLEAPEKTALELFKGLKPTNPLHQSRITDLAKDSPEWISLITRFGTVTDKGFPVRAHDGMRLVFEPYVDEVLSGREIPFEAMLRAHHQIAVAGVEGTNRYWGSSMGTTFNKAMLNSAVPGKFRHEVYNKPELFRWRTVVSITGKLDGAAPSIPKGVDVPLRIQGIPKELLPTRRLWGDRVILTYPSVKEVPVYIKSMESDLAVVLSLMKAGHDRSEILPYLADYVQKGVVGHVFNLANFSIFMTQANGILRRLGYRGVLPRNLDYHALVEDSDVFRQRFISEVRKSD